MADLVLGAGTSHSPLLSLTGADWLEWGRNDRTSTLLYDARGRQRSWDDLVMEAGDRFATLATVDACDAAHKRTDAALDELAARLDAASPDVVVVVGDDQDEHLLASNLPPVLVYWGATIGNRSAHDDVERPGVVARYRVGYLEDGPDREYPVHSDLATHIIDTMLGASIDVASSNSLPNRSRAMGHAFAFPLRRILPDSVPIVPVMVNTYNQPSQPRAARCVDYGIAIRAAIDTFDAGRIGLLASGGLSHMVVMPELDERVLDAFRRHALDELTTLPEALFQSGTSEIKNWITVAAACSDKSFDVIDYVPGYRSEAGTGVGLAFATWQ